MDISYKSDRGVAVTLSVKNLLQLLERATANGGYARLERSTAGGELVVNVEPDAAHYAAQAEHPQLRGKLLRRS